jgi:hypothetical protein
MRLIDCVAAAALISGVAGTPAHADFATIHALQEVCSQRPDSDVALSFYCMGFINGIGDLMALNGADRSEYGICPRGGGVPTQER